jgi:putative DNA primase/helicase
MLLGTPTGVVELDTATFRPGRPEDNITKSTAVGYDPDAKCPRWERFLEEIFAGDEALVHFAWLAAGYSFTGALSEQIFLMLYGSGSNGKSTFTDTLGNVLADYRGNTDTTTFDAHTNINVQVEFAALDGARFITVSEASKDARMNEEKIKKFASGNDPISCRPLFKPPYSYVPVGKLWFSCNTKPKISDDTHGFWRRVRLLPFTCRFDINKDLPLILADEAPGILRWAVDGAAMWHCEGLRTPGAVVAASDEWRTESDDIADFIEDSCVLGDNCRVGAAELYGEYCRWADEAKLSDREKLTSTRFGRRANAKFDRIKSGGSRYYLGVGIRTER